MRQKVVFICEQCGKESISRDEIWQCEAADLGLTTQELDLYRTLQGRAESWAAILSRTNNQENRDAEEAVIRELLEFEQEHGIKQQN